MIDVAEGTPEYETRLKSAKTKFAAKYNPTPAPATAGNAHTCTMMCMTVG